VVVLPDNSRHILPLSLPPLARHPHGVVADNQSSDGSAGLVNLAAAVIGLD
jgi:hypothetical protein